MMKAYANGDENGLREVDSSLKHAQWVDKAATATFYLISGAFVLLLIAFTGYVIWGGIKAFSPEIFHLARMESVTSSSIRSTWSSCRLSSRYLSEWLQAFIWQSMHPRGV